MVFVVFCVYQPRGAAEKSHLWRFLTNPDIGTSLDGALTLGRKWLRLYRRELDGVLPDPSLLCRGLDKLVSMSLEAIVNPTPPFGCRPSNWKGGWTLRRRRRSFWTMPSWSLESWRPSLWQAAKTSAPLPPPDRTPAAMMPMR